MDNNTNPIDLLINTQHPYALEGQNEALFNAAMEHADQWHRQHNSNYTKLWDIEPQPLLPVDLFKTLDLTTETHSDGMWLNSSGTGALGKTAVFFDNLSLQRIEMGMVKIFRHHQLISPIPARFLLLSPDPSKCTHVGFATAFLRFTQCAPIHEIVFAVTPQGELDNELAWSTLKRWSNDDVPIYIFGLTLYFECLCLSRPEPFELKSCIRGLSGGGWKGMTKKLERLQIIQGLQETLQAPLVDIRDIYGMTEHPLHYISCSEGHFHIPAFSRFAIIDEQRKRVPENQVGFIMLESPLFASLPSQRLLTQDLGSWGKQCNCGLPLPFLRYIGRATSLEGTCAAQVK